MKRNLEQKALILNIYIQQWFNLYNKMEARPKDLMPYLIQKGIYKNDNKDGTPLRNDLRKLRDREMLYLIKGVKACRKGEVTYWYFYKFNWDNPEFYLG